MEDLLPMGSAFELMNAISGVFPSTTWHLAVPEDESWFGGSLPEFRAPEFQLTEDDGEVTMFMVSHIEPQMLHDLMGQMHLVAFDMQTCEIMFHNQSAMGEKH